VGGRVGDSGDGFVIDNGHYGLLNITTLMAWVIASVLAALSAVHGYWAFGGRLARNAAVPERPVAPEDARTVRAFEPSPLATLLVAGALALVAALVCLRAGLIGKENTHGSLKWSLRVVASAFLLRAIGDFRLVGFFKRPQRTLFARLDTALYSPLCLALGLGLLRVAWD